MNFLFPFATERPFFFPPQSLLGWIIWFLWVPALVLLLRRWRRFNSPLSQGKRWIFLLLLVAEILFSFMAGFWMPQMGALPLPGLPITPPVPVLMIFAAVPWFLAAGMLGPLYAAILGLISGAIMGVYSTHNPFLMLELALLGTLLGASLRQRYRTPLYRMLRHPLIAMIVLLLVYSLIFTINATALASGTLVARLDYAISNLSPMLLAVGGMMLAGGVVSEILMFFKIAGWGSTAPLEPSPAERSLQARFFYAMLPISLVVVILLIVSDWFVAGQAARQMLEDRMSSAVGSSIQGIPFFLEAGQDLILQISADPRLYTSPGSDVQDALRENLRRVPFFRQLYYLDLDKDLVAGFPAGEYEADLAPLEEQTGIDLAINGVRIQYYTIPPDEGMNAAQVSFLANVLDSSQQIQGVIIGRVDMESNPFTQQIITGLESLADIEGLGYLLDEQGRILYHSLPGMVMADYPGQADPDDPFTDQTASNGTRSLVYYEQAIGRPWAAAMWVPARQSQQLSLEFAAPLLVMIVLLAGITLVMARYAILGVTNSLEVLAEESNRIAQGQLDHALAVDGQDEIGRLRRSFELMRRSLKARLDELRQLLNVSQGVATSLDLEESMMPVLEAAVASGLAAATIVFDPRAFAELSQTPGAVPKRLALGPAADRFMSIDDQVLELANEQEQILLTNPARVRVLRFESEQGRPQAMAVFAMRHENRYYGVLWLAYDRLHAFTDEETRYFTTLASQAALAAANANLFLSAELGRQRLAAILESTPDPVLVTDSQNRLLLANPAARKAVGREVSLDAGRDVKSLLPIVRLAELLQNDAPDRQSAEITLPDGRTYLAIASSTMMNGQRGGRVCVMRDITQFKELDALKSEFVSTVSHDLRSPLTLIHGYATMLQMVGELNDQQANYASKIVSGIENMSRLVTNLLDLGRIEAGVGLKLELVPVRDVTEHAASALQHQATQRQVAVIVEFPENLEPIVEADAALLQQALQNLVENAIKYTEGGGRVEIGFEVQGENVILYVKDSGIGIAPVDQSRLFEKFYRVARRGAMQAKGTGLGLAIVKSIAERHGGRVWVESQLGKGSIFYFSIPLRQQLKKS